MAYVITKACIDVKDTACVDVCPMDCIHPTKFEAGFADAKQLFINPVECIDCGMCVAECPVNAIYQDQDVPVEFEEFIQRNAAHFQK
jgi:NAD-dependent dihydropyrimidine dehydrogenase PreA subunit